MQVLDRRDAPQVKHIHSFTLIAGLRHLASANVRERVLDSGLLAEWGSISACRFDVAKKFVNEFAKMDEQGPGADGR